MNKLFKIFLVAALALGGLSIGAAAQAGNNESQGGDIESEVEQSGSSNSGDAVGGQVVGVVSAGDASVDATNRSEDVDIETGEASGTNEVSEPQIGQVDGGNNEMQGGDITSEVSQAAAASSGDGVGGQVIGVVTSAGGSADVVAANTSEDVDIETGDAFADNLLSEPFVGQDNGNNNEMQGGDIELEAAQAASAASGDGVGGQVLGIVSAGDASVDATNETTDSDVETGDAFADNLISEPQIGQVDGGNNEMQGGDIGYSVAQDASANSGDAVAGQVAGVVTSAGGSADLVLANTSDDVDAVSGDSEFFNEDSEPFVGQEG